LLSLLTKLGNKKGLMKDATRDDLEASCKTTFGHCHLGMNVSKSALPLSVETTSLSSSKMVNDELTSKRTSASDRAEEKRCQSSNAFGSEERAEEKRCRLKIWARRNRSVVGIPNSGYD
jgi:hypothetical protein